MSNTVYVLDTYHADAIARLQSTPDLRVILSTDPLISGWRENADAILVRSDSQITARDLASATRLRVIVKQGVGVDNIDLEAAKKAGIAVHNTPAMNSEAVAELSLALGLALARRIPEFDQNVRACRQVPRAQMLGLSLYKKTVGVVGMGNIGRAAARKWLGACESTIVAYDPVAPADAWADIPHQRFTSLDELCRVADILTLHVPLLPTTHNMISAAQLSLLPPNAIIINTARGGLINEADLMVELGKGRLWGVALDALETEPPTWEAHSGLLQSGKVIITPHVGASTRETQSASGIAAVMTVMAVLRGEEAPGKLA